jgi:DNA (cytosine-5)-methyltransferase 1
MNGLDLFSGIGAVSEALAPWVQTVAYCEIDAKARGILLSRQYRGEIDRAPVWDDVKTLRGRMLPQVDIITGGFPCQDISLAGARAGLAGQRSQLFWQIIRLGQETKAPFIFLENVWPGVRKFVPAIRDALESNGYNCRDGVLSAADCGARHVRKRWFLLAYSSRFARRIESRGGAGTQGQNPSLNRNTMENRKASVTHGPRVACGGLRVGLEKKQPFAIDLLEGNDWNEYTSFFLRMDHGLPNRGDRIRALGNTNPPIQYREAFKRLAGLK